MSNQDIVTLSLTSVVVLFFFMLAALSWRTAKQLAPLKDTEEGETGIITETGQVAFIGTKSEQILMKLPGAVHGLALIGGVGFILSLVPWAIELWYLCSE